jgi:peptidoglycan/xylan/chitin deacetylase (PgdA/CDA1 family)
MYHRVAEETFDPWGLAVAPRHFKSQLQWLRENRTVLSLVELATMHRDGTLPANAIALTFDDGYSCAAEVAAPMLEEAALSATVFIPPELITRGRPFWWDELQQLILAHDDDYLMFEGARITLGAKQGRDSHWKPGSPPQTPRQRAFHDIWSALLHRAPTEIDRAIADLRAQVADRPTGRTPHPMRPEVIRRLARGPLELGSHALAHPWLSTLDRAEKTREIRASVEACAALSGSAPRTFAYPFGNFDEESEQIVEQAGFACGCTTLGTAVRPTSRPFALPRMAVGNWSPRQLARALAAA